MNAILKLERINSFYGPIQVHYDFSLEVGRGQIVCLLGGNASGKSTTMKVILGSTARPSPACRRQKSSGAGSARCPRRAACSAP